MYDNYKRIRNEMHLYGELKTNTEDVAQTEMDHDFYGLQKEIWCFIKVQRTEVKELIESNDIENDTWIDHLKKLCIEEHQITLELETPEITINEDVHVSKKHLKERRIENPQVKTE